MVVVVGDDHQLRTLFTGDVAANEIYYHTQCLRNLHNKFNKAQKQTKPNFTEQNESDCIKVSALNKVFYYMCDIEQQERSKIFKVKDLENMYIELLKCQGIDVQSHVSHSQNCSSTADAFFNDAYQSPQVFQGLSSRL